MTYSQSLGGLRVLITRPEKQSETLASTVRDLGGDTFDFPLLKVDSIKNELRISELEEKVKKLSCYDKLIFVSKNAVTYGAEVISKNWPHLPTEVEVIAIGSSTAKVASDFFGCEVMHPISGSVSEDLITLPCLANVKQKRIAIFRGTGGREFLAGSLKDRGAEVEYFEVYERSPTERGGHELLEIIIEHNVNVLTITSGDSLRVLYKLFLESRNGSFNLFSIPIVVPSARVSRLAEKLGFQQIKLAQGADARATVSALYEVASEADKSDYNQRGN